MEARYLFPQASLIFKDPPAQKNDPTTSFVTHSLQLRLESSPAPFADYVTLQEFSTLPTAAMDEYMNYIKEKHPAHRERFSNQAWLLQGKTADDVLKRLRKR